MTDLDQQLLTQRLDALKRIEAVILNVRASLLNHKQRYDVLQAAAGDVTSQARLRWEIEIDRIDIGPVYVKVQHGITFQIIRIGHIDIRRAKPGIHTNGAIPLGDAAIDEQFAEAQKEVAQAISQAAWITHHADTLAAYCKTIRELRESIEVAGMPRLRNDDAFLYRIYPELFGDLTPF